MKSTITAIALAAVAGVASAQTATINYSVGGEDAESFAFAANTTYTVDVAISFEGGETNLLAIDFSTLFDGAGDAGGAVIDEDYLAQGGSVVASASGIEVNTLGPSSILAPAAGSPQALFSFELTTGGSNIDVTHADWLITTFNAQFQTADHAIVGSDETWVVPAPGAMAIAGLGGLVATRRRRA